jgi:hypothetical protein
VRSPGAWRSIFFVLSLIVWSLITPSVS